MPIAGAVMMRFRAAYSFCLRGCGEVAHRIDGWDNWKFYRLGDEMGNFGAIGWLH